MGKWNKATIKKLTICHLGHKNVLERSGGIEVVVHELASRMAGLGHNVTCFNRSGHHVSGQELVQKKLKEYNGIHLKYVFTIRRRGLAAITSSISAALCAALGKYDIVHFHAEGPAAMCWLPKLTGKKVVVTIHGLDWQRAKWGKFASKYIMLGEKCAVKYADKVIVLSKNIQEYFWKTYGRETVFIPNGISRPTEVPANLIQKKWGLEKDDYILFLGRLVPEKGIEYLIKAFKKTATTKKLVIAGGTSDTDSFVTELKLSSIEDKRILFTGFAHGKVLEELYSNAYLYVLPSDLEGMPLSLLEAMSYGNCCVVSDIPECMEVVEDKALLFPKGNIDKLAKCLQNLCDNKVTVDKYRSEAADFICAKYNWDDVVSKTEHLYINALKCPGKSSDTLRKKEYVSGISGGIKNESFND